jgi:hypothetical protein
VVEVHEFEDCDNVPVTVVTRDQLRDFVDQRLSNSEYAEKLLIIFIFYNTVSTP